MRVPIDDTTGCALCRFMRGVAFGGAGAAVIGFPAHWLGFDQQTTLIDAFFGALIIGGWLNRWVSG
ncbi:MAG: hypothetical protein U5S82_12530 [Gammaproteobacteria bacterium]|nr:hypothetical protein [Gammaproteobacteria bacterium]